MRARQKTWAGRAPRQAVSQGVIGGSMAVRLVHAITVAKQSRC